MEYVSDLRLAQTQLQAVVILEIARPVLRCRLSLFVEARSALVLIHHCRVVAFQIVRLAVLQTIVSRMLGTKIFLFSSF